MALMGCASPENGQGAAQQFELIGASVTTAHPASVFVKTSNGGRCSGSLVHPRVVVTAWHCLPANGVTMSVDVTEPGGVVNYPVTAQFAPSTETFAATLEHMGKDVAALALGSPVQGVTPYPMRLDGLQPVQGEAVRAVAFGGGSSLFGQAQTATGTLLCGDFNANFPDLAFPMLTTTRGAGGDSGGSLLDSSGRLLATLSGMLSQSGCLFDGGVVYSAADEIWGARIERTYWPIESAFMAVGATAPSRPDAGGRLADAGAETADAGSSDDAGNVGVDAGSDAGAAAVVASDAGAQGTLDGGGGADASVDPVSPGPLSGSCGGCTAATGSGVLLSALVALLSTRRRRVAPR